MLMLLFFAWLPAALISQSLDQSDQLDQLDQHDQHVVLKTMCSSFYIYERTK